MEDYRSKVQRYRELSANNNNSWGGGGWGGPKQAWDGPWDDKFPVNGPDVDGIEQDVDSGEEADVGDDEMEEEELPRQDYRRVGGGGAMPHRLNLDRVKSGTNEVRSPQQQDVNHVRSPQQEPSYRGSLLERFKQNKNSSGQEIRAARGGSPGGEPSREGGAVQGGSLMQRYQKAKQGVQEGSLLDRYNRNKQLLNKSQQNGTENGTPNGTQLSTKLSQLQVEPTQHTSFNRLPNQQAYEAQQSLPSRSDGVLTTVASESVPVRLRERGGGRGVKNNPNRGSWYTNLVQNQQEDSPQQSGTPESQPRTQQYNNTGHFPQQYTPEHPQNTQNFTPDHQRNSHPYSPEHQRNSQHFTSEHQRNTPQYTNDSYYMSPSHGQYMVPNNQPHGQYMPPGSQSHGQYMSPNSQTQFNSPMAPQHGHYVPSASPHQVFSPSSEISGPSPFHNYLTSTPYQQQRPQRQNQSYFIQDVDQSPKRRSGGSGSSLSKSQSFNAGRGTPSGRETPRKRWDRGIGNYKLATSTGELRSSTGNLSAVGEPQKYASLGKIHRSNSNKVAKQVRQAQGPKSYTVSMINLNKQPLSPRSDNESSNESSVSGYASMNSQRPASTTDVHTMNHSRSGGGATSYRPSSSYMNNSSNRPTSNASGILQQVNKSAPSPKMAIHPVPVYQDQTKLDEALLSAGHASDALNSLHDWLNKAELYLAEDQPILGDLDTVNILIEQHKAFQQELNSRQVLVEQIASGEVELGDEGFTLSPAQITELSHLTEHVARLSDVRETRLHEALRLAEDFSEAVTVIREWLPSVEAELKFKSHAEDEEGVMALIEQHQGFQEELQSKQPEVERIRNLAEEILNSCHPNAVRFVRYYLTITHVRWEQALTRAEQKGQKLEELLLTIRSNTALMHEHLAWLSEALALLTTKHQDSVPDDLTVVEALLNEHNEFHDDLTTRSKDIEKLTASLPQGGRKGHHGSHQKLSSDDEPSGQVTSLHYKWRTVWKMSSDRKEMLQGKYDQLVELENFKNFDFETWRVRYNTWIRAKKLRITDFFRRQDKEGYGTLSRDQFVKGMLSTNFPTNATELHAVFDRFDPAGVGELNYNEFMAALKVDGKKGGGGGGLTEGQMVQQEIEQQVAQCQCRQQFKVNKLEEGKYRFGERQKLYLVRFLNNTVMVRVGGGWISLKEFLGTNDPCRAMTSRLSTSITNLQSGGGTPQQRMSSARSESNLFMGSRAKSGSNTNLSTPNRPTTPKSTTPKADGRRTPTTDVPRRSSLSSSSFSGGITSATRARQGSTSSGTPGNESGRKTPTSQTRSTESGRKTPTGQSRASESGRRTPTSQSRVTRATPSLVRDRPMTKSLNQRPMRF